MGDPQVEILRDVSSLQDESWNVLSFNVDLSIIIISNLTGLELFPLAKNRKSQLVGNPLANLVGAGLEAV